MDNISNFSWLATPRIFELNGQSLFPVYAADGGLSTDVALYVVVNGHRKEVRFTWDELHEATKDKAIAVP